MKFSTSAALAAIALHAGQTWAAIANQKCSLGLRQGQTGPRDACDMKKINGWSCSKHGARVDRDANTYHFSAGRYPVTLRVCCLEDCANKYINVFCPAGAFNEYKLICGTTSPYVEYWVNAPPTDAPAS
ncbi:hypothetical protein E4U53_006153 [Claviceps sorghi]|nr:hypothetical protein E4U53_006153 [Claviceps sorghi]